MRLSRRDAIAALAAVGAAGSAVGVSRLLDEPPRADPADESSGDELPGDERVEEALIAAAEVLYPTAVSGIEEFVAAFLAGRLDDADHAAALRRAVGDLDELARSWYDGRFAALDADERDSFLREVGADVADEDPGGTTAERVRYYVVNELLLALYASPTGGELVGIENPQGHPGGQTSYRRGPGT